MQQPKQLTREQKDVIAGIQLTYYCKLGRYRTGVYGREATEVDYMNLSQTHNLMIHLIANPESQGPE